MERQFVFIDETGDPGHPEQRDASPYYQLNILSIKKSGLGKLSREFSRFRYFLQANKELERYVRENRSIFIDLCRLLSNDEALFYSFCIDKQRYVGPYLKNIGRGRFEYNPKLFRNFIIRKSLEEFFKLNPAGVGQEIELVIDRFLDNEEDENNLKKYLHNNYKLPKFLHIVQIDSRYSDAVQVVDVFGTLVKSCRFDSRIPFGLIDFANIFELENPKIIKRKSPDTH